LETKIIELAEKIREKTASNAKIVFCPLPEDDPKRRRPDITKAARELKWHPEVSLDEGLNRTIGWFKARTNKG
jgi:nucleoside-diphosphate-sugar epimerase